MKYNIVSHIPAVIFQAYDIRGIVDATLNEAIIYTLGLAIGSEANQNGWDEFVVARDGRLSGSIYITALIQGLRESGCQVVDIGMVPTPVLYFSTHHLSVQCGVMLTGSHNPPHYNGLKIVIGGETLADARIRALNQRIQDQNFSKGYGGYKTIDIVSDYLLRIHKDINLARKLKVVVDCGNGVAGEIAPKLLRLLGCEVIELFCEIDGRFPNHSPDPSIPANFDDLIRAVQSHQADVGLAFDGDADRLGVVTNTGKIIWPDRQMMLFAIDVLKRNPGATILYDIKCSRHLAEIIEQVGGRPFMWKTGHSLIKAKLSETKALLAGEMSGHIFFKERWYGFDDGLYAAARLLEIIASDESSVADVFARLPESIATPELRLPIPEERKFAFMDAFKESAQFDGGKLSKLDGLRVDYDYGWGLIRPSNTTAFLILRFEANNETNLKRIQDDFKQALLAFEQGLDLPF